MCIARRDTISGHFVCHRNSDLTRLKKKAYLSVDLYEMYVCVCVRACVRACMCFVINKLYLPPVAVILLNATFRKCV